jgi:hypothetical protein
VSAQLNRVECRSRTCVANLTWQDRNIATQDFEKILTLAGDSFSGCTTQIYLAPGGAAPYQAPLIITDCRH